MSLSSSTGSSQVREDPVDIITVANISHRAGRIGIGGQEFVDRLLRYVADVHLVAALEEALGSAAANAARGTRD